MGILIFLEVLKKPYLCLLWQSDVNTVCFADESGHLIYSGSDDSLCKVNYISSCSLSSWSLHTKHLYFDFYWI